MSAEHPEIIIIKRIVKHEEEHHGGAWKIAFADFMTAMMAFFLVLWIINATDKSTKTIIARYFNPVKLEDPSRSTKGIHVTEQGKPKGKDDPGGTEVAQPDANESMPEAPKKADPGKKQESGSAQAKTPPDASTPRENPDPASPQPTMAENELFADPYDSLDRIENTDLAQKRAASSLAKGGGEEDALTDPFQPRVRDPVISSDTRKLPENTAAAPSRAADVSDQQATKVEGVEAAAVEKPVVVSDWIGKLKTKIGLLGATAPGPTIDIRQTPEGILISLTDGLNFSMFPLGSAEPQARLVKLMDLVAAELRNRPGQIVVRGHTDGKPFKSGIYDNWRLSSARAQMGYYMLTRGGVPEDRFRRIEGYGDHQLKDAAHPTAAANRRLEILLIEPK